MLLALILAAALSDDEALPRALDLDPPSDERPSRERAVRLSAVGRRFEGRVQVREHEVEGTPLRLGGDLGYGSQWGGRAAFAYDSPTVEAHADVDYMDGSARRRATRDFFFNGAAYAAGEDLKTLTHFLTVRIDLAWKSFADPGRGAWTGPILGIEYPYYYMNLITPSIPGNSEDWTHYYPYPVVGWAGRVPVTEGLRLEGRATVGYVPDLPSAFIEGGRLYVSVRPSVWVDLALVWELSRAVRLGAGFEYGYWNGADHSVEDGNRLKFSSPGAALAIEFAW
jgi:hypothetical protein